MRKLAVLLAVAALTVGLAACGGDDDDDAGIDDLVIGSERG